MKKGKKKTIEWINILFRKINIFPRLILIMLTLSIIPMIFIMFFSFKEYSGEIKENTKQYISLLVGNMQVQVEERMETFERVAWSFYSDEVMIDLLRQNLEISRRDKEFLSNQTYIDNKRLIGESLYYFAGGNNYIHNIEFITEYDQYTMLNLKGEKRGAVVKDLDEFLRSSYYLDAKENKGYPCWFDTSGNRDLIYKYEDSRSGIGNTLTMTVGVYTLRSREFLGEVLLNIDVNSLTQSLTNYSFYGTGNTFLLGEDSIIGILNPNINAPTFDYEDGLQNKVFGHNEGEFIQTLDGKRIFVSFQKIPSIGLYIAHLVDMEILLAPAYSILNRCLFLVVLLLVASIVITHWTTNSISEPLKQLTKSMARFIDNHFTERCVVTGNDELTVVSKKFNVMAGSTQQLVEEIVQSNLHQKTLELSKTHAELNALQMQINPHFLYNTLDLIRWETIHISKSENDASRMIDSFCKLMRMSIKSSEHKVSLSEELEHAKAYLDVINFRGGNEIQLICEMAFDIELCRMPKLTLQPLIENAIAHGFTRKFKNPTIHLYGYLIRNSVIITILDNGRGMEKEKLEKLRSSLSGEESAANSIGLHNVNQRFKLYYGEEYGVTVKSEQAVGTQITIKIPQNI